MDPAASFLPRWSEYILHLRPQTRTQPKTRQAKGILEVKGRDNPFISHSSADSVVFPRDEDRNITLCPGFDIKTGYTRDKVHETMHLYCETRDRGND
jgi:hypothetical protein